MKRSAYNHQYHASNREHVKSLHYKSRYGITLDAARVLLASQGGACAICRKVISLDGVRGRDGACVDHCHSTNAVRGLLCTPCNLLLGYAHDDAETVRRAADYLERA